MLTARRLRCSGAGAIAAWALPSLGPAMRMCAANLLLGFVLDLIMVGTIKGLVRRGRPVYNKEGDFVLVVSVDKFSFPSGHSSRCASRGREGLAQGFTVCCLNPPWWLQRRFIGCKPRPGSCAAAPSVADGLSSQTGVFMQHVWCLHPGTC